MPMKTSLFLAPHPDDEAIFTGGTAALLAGQGQRVIIAFATDGQLGQNQGDHLGELRCDEARAACELLGAESIFLNYHDSGLDSNEFPIGCFATSDTELVAQSLADIISSLKIDALFCDDQYGIYGHPDHVQAHKVGIRAAALSGIKELYFTTVDREYLHFVESHLVEEAHASHPHESEALHRIGMSSIEITHTVNVSDVLDTKRASMSAHKSQLNDTSSAFVMNNEDFRNVYGYEWFISVGSNSETLSCLPSL